MSFGAVWHVPCALLFFITQAVWARDAPMNIIDIDSAAQYRKLLAENADVVLTV